MYRACNATWRPAIGTLYCAISDKPGDTLADVAHGRREPEDDHTMHASAKPLIGITSNASTETLNHGTFERSVLSRTYTDAVRAVDGVPIILSADQGDVEPLLDRIDGILLSGGSDLDPNRYSDGPTHPTTYGIDPERDGFELALVAATRDRDLPLLGICRGIQSLNVAMGGTLYQDIDDQTTTTVNHRQQQAGYARDATSHDVAIASGDNPLSHLVGPEPLAVNSFHHQGIRDLAPGLEIIAWAPDNLAEAVWDPTLRFCLAVQWHPEMLALSHPRHLAIFRGLVAAASPARAAVAM